MTGYRKRSMTRLAVTFCALIVLTMVVSVAAAQDTKQSADSKSGAEQGFLGSVSRWFEEQSANFNSSLSDTRKKLENLGHDAGNVAKTTAEEAKSAADAVARLPNSRVITGHEKCRVAANGAPDCVAAAKTICKGQGFGSGKSLDFMTSETCPPKVYLSGRSSGTECTTETFVSRALCQ